MTLMDLITEAVDAMRVVGPDAEVHLGVRYEEPDGAAGMLRRVEVDQAQRAVWLSS